MTGNADAPPAASDPRPRPDPGRRPDPASSLAPTPRPAHRVTAYAWYALAVFVLVYALNFIDRQVLSILAESIKADLKLDDAQRGSSTAPRSRCSTPCSESRSGGSPTAGIAGGWWRSGWHCANAIRAVACGSARRRRSVLSRVSHGCSTPATCGLFTAGAMRPIGRKLLGRRRSRDLAGSRPAADARDRRCQRDPRHVNGRACTRPLRSGNCRQGQWQSGQRDRRALRRPAVHSCHAVVCVAAHRGTRSDLRGARCRRARLEFI